MLEETLSYSGGFVFAEVSKWTGDLRPSGRAVDGTPVRVLFFPADAVRRCAEAVQDEHFDIYIGVVGPHEEVGPDWCATAARLLDSDYVSAVTFTGDHGLVVRQRQITAIADWRNS